MPGSDLALTSAFIVGLGLEIEKCQRESNDTKLLANIGKRSDRSINLIGRVGC